MPSAEKDVPECGKRFYPKARGIGYCVCDRPEGHDGMHVQTRAPIPPGTGDTDG